MNKVLNVVVAAVWTAVTVFGVALPSAGVSEHEAPTPQGVSIGFVPKEEK